MKLQWLLPVFLASAVIFAGCLGGGGEGEKEPEYVTFSDGMQLTGSEVGLAQIEPVDLEAVVGISLSFDRVIKMQINISVEDGDPDTQVDTVGSMTLRPAEGEGEAITINGGNTPLTQTVTIEWKPDTGEYINSTWELVIPVSIKAGEDQWPGPLIWRGIPDRGFSWTVDVNYDYHEVSEE